MIIDKASRSSIAGNRKRFFEGNRYSPKDDRTDIVEYCCKPFDLAKHLTMHTSKDVGY